jgi:hypothetical protein
MELLTGNETRREMTMKVLVVGLSLVLGLAGLAHAAPPSGLWYLIMWDGNTGTLHIDEHDRPSSLGYCLGVVASKTIESDLRFVLGCMRLSDVAGLVAHYNVKVEYF